jgi:hypothetical protein
MGILVWATLSAKALGVRTMAGQAVCALHFYSSIARLSLAHLPLPLKRLYALLISLYSTPPQAPSPTYRSRRLPGRLHRLVSQKYHCLHNPLHLQRLRRHCIQQHQKHVGLLHRHKLQSQLLQADDRVLVRARPKCSSGCIYSAFLQCVKYSSSGKHHYRSKHDHVATNLRSQFWTIPQR